MINYKQIIHLFLEQESNGVTQPTLFKKETIRPNIYKVHYNIFLELKFSGS